MYGAVSHNQIREILGKSFTSFRLKLYLYNGKLYFNTYKLYIKNGEYSSYKVLGEVGIIDFGYNYDIDSVEITYTSENKEDVEEYCNTALLMFGNVYDVYDIDLLNVYLKALSEYKRGGMKERIQVANVIYLFLAFKYEDLRKDYFIIEEVSKLPLYSKEFTIENVYQKLLLSNLNAYDDDGSLVDIYVKDIDKVFEMGRNLKEFLSDYGFFGHKLVVKQHEMYHSKLMVDKAGRLNSMSNIPYDSFCIKGFNDTEENYNKYVLDNDIKIYSIFDEIPDDIKQTYFKLPKDYTDVYKLIDSILILLNCKGRLDDIDAYGAINYCYLYSALLMFTPIIEEDVEILSELGKFKLNWLDSELLEDKALDKSIIL